MTNTIKTKLHTYNFDVSKPDEKAAWHELRAKLEKGPHCFGPVLSDVWHKFKPLDGDTLELETTHLFDNQWNTAPIAGVTDKGLRVFDWALESYRMAGVPDRIRRGHYLEQTTEMRALRDNIDACGYCGKQEPAAKGCVFCPHCIDSEYLKASELHLTRMRPVSTPFGESRAPLTEAEKAHLLPLYREAQTHGITERGKARLKAKRLDVQKTYDATIRNARIEYEGFNCLLDRGITADPIFYTHTGRFGFGWRQPLDAEQLSALLEVISEFPFPYDIKCADGRTLSGN